jgi:hypothetical protein
LFVLLHDFGAERHDVGDEGIIVLFRETVNFHAGVDDKLQDLFLLLGIGDFLFEEGQTIACDVLNRSDLT